MKVQVNRHDPFLLEKLRDFAGIDAKRQMPRIGHSYADHLGIVVGVRISTMDHAGKRIVRRVMIDKNGLIDISKIQDRYNELSSIAYVQTFDAETRVIAETRIGRSAEEQLSHVGIPASVQVHDDRATITISRHQLGDIIGRITR